MPLGLSLIAQAADDWRIEVFRMRLNGMRSTNPIWRLDAGFWSTGFVEREKNAGNSRKRRSREEVRRLVDEFEASGLERAQFCRKRNLALLVGGIDLSRTRRKEWYRREEAGDKRVA
jgi:hypothetical protein